LIYEKEQHQIDLEEEEGKFLLSSKLVSMNKKND
jgi:hypothetical protein